MKFDLTKHAKRALAEREIPMAWVEHTLASPELRRPDPEDATVERRYRKTLNLAGAYCTRLARQLNPTGR